MAFGFPPKYLEEYLLNDLPKDHFLVIAVEAAKKLGWNVGRTTANGFVAYTSMSITSWSEQVIVRVGTDTVTLISQSTGSQLADWGKNENNVGDLIATITAIRKASTPEDLGLKHELLVPSLDPDEGEWVTPKKNGNIFFSLFAPKPGYFITPVLIDLNIFIFVLMAISGAGIFVPDTQIILAWGANFRPMTLDGGWWRLLTCCFLHFGIVHLVMNMYALTYIGLILEPYLGKSRFAAAYILTGIAASLASLSWHDLTVSAGASGAIFGMYGVFIALLTTDLIDKSTRRAVFTSIAIFVTYNLLNGLKGEIDNAAHVGGLLSGLVIGYAFVPSLRNTDEPTVMYSAITLLTLLTLTASMIVLRTIPNDIVKYDEKIKEFTAFEGMALEFYSMPQTTPKDQLLTELKNRGLYYWTQNVNLVNDLDKLNLPEFVHERNKILLRYCNLRLKSYKLMYKTIDEDTGIYRDSLEVYNKQIQSIIDDLKGKN